MVAMMLVGLSLSSSLFSAAAQSQVGKVEEVGPPPEAAVQGPILQSLSTRGYRITPATDGSEIEIWYCKKVAAQTKNAASDAVYDRIPESSLVGVLHFTRNSNDYRGQSIAAGYYTLRYALMPNDGNHLGVAPGRDFVLLAPVAADPGSPNLATVQELIGLSRQAAGTRHPAPMLLVPASGDGAKPALSTDAQGDLVFTTHVRVADGESLPIALVVKGTAPQ
jgi:hypothetical protein